VQFALSLEKYDMALHQPHPPGYLFYSFSLRAINWILKDPNWSMILLNILATILSGIFVFLSVEKLCCGLRISNARLLSAAGSLLYATNPITWFYTCVAEVYPVEAFFSSLVVYLLILSLEHPRLMLYTSAVLGISGGFRLTTEFFLLPPYLFVLWKTKRAALLNLGILILATASWVVPSGILAGGLDIYCRRVFNQFFRTGTATSVFAASPKTTSYFVTVLIRTFQAITIPGLVILLSRIRKFSPNLVPKFLLLFPLPPLLFFTFVNLSKDGYFLLVVPAITVLVVTVLAKICSSRLTMRVLLLSIALNMLTFYFPHPPGTEKLSTSALGRILDTLESPNRAEILNRNSLFAEFMKTVARLKQGKALFIVTEVAYPDFRLLMYYFPDDVTVFPSSSPGLKKSWALIAEKRQAIRKQSTLNLDRSIRTLFFVSSSPGPNWMSSFQISSVDYWFAQRQHVPKEFQIEFFTFVKQ
jgi:Protein of unknown function (DUF2723)